MFKTIVVGCDGQRGRGAAALGQALATATGAQLLLVGVQPELPLRLVESYPEMRAALEAQLRGVRDTLAPAARIQISIDLSASHALGRIAQDEHADLIIVGSRQPGAARRLASGDNAMGVLHSSPCAVAVAPDDLPPRRELATIGIGLDATPEAHAALRLALELARCTGAAVKLLAVASDAYPGMPHIFSPATYDDDTYARVIDDRVQTARTMIEEALAECAGAAATGDVRLGNPARELAAFSAECDLLVLGSRRWGPVRRLVLGSTSEPVLRRAQCPVLVLPRNAVTEYDETRDRPVPASGSELDATGSA